MTYKQPSQEAAQQRSPESLVSPETVIGSATAILGRAALLLQKNGKQGDLLADLMGDGLPASSHAPDAPPQAQAETPSPCEQSTQPTREDLYALQIIINSYDHQVAQHPRSKALKEKRAAAWYNLDIAIAKTLGITPEQYAQAHTNRDAQFDEIVLERMRIRREVKEAAQATHPSQTAAQRSNRPKRSAQERLFSPQDAAAGEYVVRPKLPKTPKKLDY
jgi:hypothetical protein